MRRALFLLIISGLILAGYFFLPKFLGEVVKEVFRDGTGCRANLKNPQLSILELTATIENISVVCPKEIGGEGFYADKLSISVGLDEIQNKTLKITNLKIEGASTESLIANSGFLKTLIFILKKGPGPRLPDDQRGWHAWVPKVEIIGKKSRPSIHFGTRDSYIAGEDVIFTSEDPINSQFTPVTLKASASNSYLIIGERKIGLGTFEYEADANEGKLKFSKARFIAGREKIEIGGEIDTKLDLLNLNFDGSASLNQILSQVDSETNSVMHFNGRAVDSIFNPEIVTDLQFNIEANKILKRSVNGSISQIVFKENRFKIDDFSLKNTTNGDRNDSKINFEFLRSESGLIGDVKISSLRLIDIAEFYTLFSDGSTSLNGVLNPEILNYKLDFEAQGTLMLESLGESILKGFGGVYAGNTKLIDIILESAGGNAHLGLLEVSSKKEFLDIGLQDNQIRGSVNITDLLLQSLLKIPKELNSNLSHFSLDSKLSGEIKDPRLQGQYSVGGYLAKDRIKGEVQINSAGVITSFNSPQNSLVGKLDYNFRASDAALQLNFIELSSNDIPYLKDRVEEDLKFTGSATFKGLPTAPLDGEGDMRIRVSLPEHLSLLQPENEIHLKLGGGELRMEELSMPLPLRMSGLLSKSKGWNLDINGLVPLGILVKNIDIMESIQGNVSLSSQVRGEIFNPEIFGQAKIDDVSFNLTVGDIILGADNIKGAVNFSGNEIEIENVQGELADGTFILRGQAESIFSKDDRLINLYLDGRNMKVEPVDGLFIDLSSSLALGIQRGIPVLLRGNVEIEEAVYENAVNLETLVKAVSDYIKNGLWARSKALSNERLSGVMADIHVASKGGMLLDTNVLQAEFLGDLHIQSDLLNPYIEGKVTVLDGGFKINQTEFQILSGELLFSEQLSVLNPKIVFTSEGSLRNRSGDETKIFLSVGGNLRNTKLSLTSEGQATSRDLAKQLGVGGGGNQLKLVDDKLSNVGFRELLSPSSDLSILERVSGLTGFDDVRVETGVSVRTGEFIPQVFASRPLPADFRGTIFSELSGDKASGGKLEYRLDDSYSLFSSWRSQAVTAASQTGGGNLGVGFQYRRTFKGISFLPNSVKSSEELRDEN